MAEPIVLIADTSEDAHDLALLLARHGLPARAHDDEVELVSSSEEASLLLAELAVALHRWLEDRGLESVTLRLGSGALVYERSARYVVGVEDPLVRAGT